MHRSFNQMTGELSGEGATDGRSNGTSSTTSLLNEIERQQAEIRALKASVSGLQAELNSVRSSVSWKVTAPLRLFARRLPRLAAFVQRTLDRTRDAVIMSLPKRAAASLIGDPWQVCPDIQQQIEAYRRAHAGTSQGIVLYTAIFGKYDNLLLPQHLDPEVDYVCFTDQPRHDYGVWQIRSAPYYHPDATRIARWVKTHPHELFPDHEIAVWLDANIILKGDIRQYIDMFKQHQAHLGLVAHPHRTCFYEEAMACKRLKKDVDHTIDKQVEHYRSNGLPPGQSLFETGLMVVLLTETETEAAFHLWWQQLEQFSRRDQLALAWVIYQFPHLKIASLLPPGTSVRDHEDFKYFRHVHARTLIVPEVLLQAGDVASPVAGIAFSDAKAERLEQVRDIPIDIVVCVHNALADVRHCLEAARESMLPKHRLIIVNDCSDADTTEYLRAFAAHDQQITLLENDENIGYTRSANRGLAAGIAEFRILLNSDTIVCRNWALKMLDAANRSDRIGIVGPVSNAAGAQSIPNIKSKGNNTAINLLPNGVSIQDLDLACEGWSCSDLFPRVPLVHGFCFGVKKAVIERVGLFDDENFKRFYGEENDYCFRALAAGFELVIATNTFVFHRKSRSIDEEKRVVHMAEAWKRLRELYGAERILLAYRQVEDHPALRRLRGEAAGYFESALAAARRAA
jgi:O-antigen biosynthesis protein